MPWLRSAKLSLELRPTAPGKILERDFLAESDRELPGQLMDGGKSAVAS